MTSAGPEGADDFDGSNGERLRAPFTRAGAIQGVEPEGFPLLAALDLELDLGRPITIVKGGVS